MPSESSDFLLCERNQGAQLNGFYVGERGQTLVIAHCKVLLNVTRVPTVCSRRIGRPKYRSGSTAWVEHDSGLLACQNMNQANNKGQGERSGRGAPKVTCWNPTRWQYEFPAIIQMRGPLEGLGGWNYWLWWSQRTFPHQLPHEFLESLTDKPAFHPFITYLSNCYDGPGSVLGTWGASLNKKRGNHCDSREKNRTG